MKFASQEKTDELYVLENEYCNLKGFKASESYRCQLRGELVKGFVKSEEMVNEAIEKLKLKIEDLRKEKTQKEEQNQKLPAGVVVAQFEGWDADTGERIHVGDWIVKTYQGWSKIENAF